MDLDKTLNCLAVSKLPAKRRRSGKSNIQRQNKWIIYIVYTIHSSKICLKTQKKLKV